MNYLRAIWGLVFTAFMVLITLGAYRAGKDRIKVDVKDETIDQIEKAKAARDRLDSDPEYADRVRDKFTR